MGWGQSPQETHFYCFNIFAIDYLMIHGENCSLVKRSLICYFLAIVTYPEWHTLVEGRVPLFDLVISLSISS